MLSLSRKIIINTVLYNEQDSIVTFLNNLSRIRDIHAVEILDGSWRKEIKSSVNSTDDTKKLVNKWIKNNSVPFEVCFTESKQIWETQSAKRNSLLELTQKKYGDCWIFVLDADEAIKFPNGFEAITLEPYLKDKTKCGVLKTYLYNSNDVLPSIRLIPTGHEIHYHTELAKMLHDNSCNILMDYNPARIFQSWDTFDFNDMFIVNYLKLQKGTHKLEKSHHHIDKNQLKDVECKWKQLYIQR